MGIDDCKKPEIRYDISKVKYYTILIIGKLFILTVGLIISYYILFKRCMLISSGCNPIVTVFFAIIALACFYNTGLPIDKILNIKLT